MSDNEAQDKKVKDLIDAATRAELEKWFGLPSFDQLAEQGKPVQPQADEDPELAERLKRRDAAIAAVNPALLAAYLRRVEPRADLIKFTPDLELKIDPSFASLDHAMVERHHVIAEPREVERPDYIEEELKERVPQALLRDLHRPETDFTKAFDVVDPLGEQRVVIAAVVAEALADKKLSLDPPGASYREACAVLREVRVALRQPWADIKTPTRRVTQ